MYGAILGDGLLVPLPVEGSTVEILDRIRHGVAGPLSQQDIAAIGILEPFGALFAALASTLSRPTNRLVRIGSRLLGIAVGAPAGPAATLGAGRTGGRGFLRGFLSDFPTGSGSVTRRVQTAAPGRTRIRASAMDRSR